MTEELRTIAQSFAVENCNDAIYPAHLFKAVLHKEMGLVHFLETELGKDYYYLQDWADIQMTLSPRATRPSSDLDLSDEAEAVIEEADNFRIRFEEKECSPVCILAALVTPGVGFTFDQLKTLPLTTAEICAKMEKGGANVNATAAAVSHPYIDNASSSTGTSNIAKYCITLGADVENETIVGFEKEIAVIFEILGRKTKSNLLVTGEAGVGKTSLIKGFVKQLTAGNVPSFLKGYQAYEVDNAALTAGASYKGEVDDRFKKVLKEIEGLQNAILIIEGIDKYFDRQENLFGASSILKNELQKGNLLLICTASVDGFTKHIETDKEFVGQLERIAIDEPTTDQCLRILNGAIPAYEKYHELTVDDEVMDASIRLAKRYLTEKALPTSAIDLIDRTLSLLKTMNDISAADVTRYKEEIAKVEEEAKGKDQKDSKVMKDLEWLNYEVWNKTSCLLTAQIADDTDFSKIATADERIKYIKDTLDKLEALTKEKRTVMNPSDLYAVVAKQTGIPLGKVQTKERDRLLGAEETLKKRVVGQDHAVKKVLDAVFESRSGLNKKGQPMGSFFFLGPTGTGKTELSKALAAFLFGDESALIRFDMSEFKEEHSVALLYGAPPGYVGYEEGGLLVNKIRQKPYSVVLFDEIEKAHKSVFDLFLQILDEGKLHDRLGRVGDFSNALILFTSNIGSQYVVDSFTKNGVPPENNSLMEIMQDYFRPEFLGRLTEIVPFSPITEQTVEKIFDIHLKGLLNQLEEQNITLTFEKEAKHQIALRGYNPQYGARPIIGIIRKEIRHPLSKLIIAGTVKSGDTVEVTLEEDGTTPKFTVK